MTTRPTPPSRADQLDTLVRDRITLPLVTASDLTTVGELRTLGHDTARAVLHDVAEQLRRMEQTVAIEDVDGVQKVTGNHGYPNRLWVKLEDVLALLGERLT
jgi:hypothetical protein